MSEHHTNSERILYNALQTAYWLCEHDEPDAAYLVMQTAVDCYEP